MRTGFALALALIAMAGLSVPATGQQRDPFGGQFGAMELAMSPAEAAASAEKMGKALAALQPQRKGVIDTYVVSASLWNDPVFENEAKEAGAILARHFDAEGRTIVLSAGTGSPTRTYPAATPDNLQAALGKIGQLIDPNEDLVVVFLTSHGGPDGAVGLQEKGRLSGALRPVNLRTSLAAAGIRNKVLIISACFSGNFIPAFFNDPNALVLTAAAADKTSFGCEPSRDFTYFGDAMFNHAMRGGQSLLDSYSEALGLISKWEDDLHAKWEAMPGTQRAQTAEPLPSNPQKNIGDSILPLVAKAEAYGDTVSCAGHLTFALDRARSSRGLKDLTDPTAIKAALATVEAKAIALGAQVLHGQPDVAKAIAASTEVVNDTFPKGTLTVAEHAAECLKSFSGGPVASAG